MIYDSPKRQTVNVLDHNLVIKYAYAQSQLFPLQTDGGCIVVTLTLDIYGEQQFIIQVQSQVSSENYLNNCTAHYISLQWCGHFTDVTYCLSQHRCNLTISYTLTTVQSLGTMPSVSGLRMQPADIWIMDIRAKTTSVRQPLFTYSL